VRKVDCGVKPNSSDTVMAVKIAQRVCEEGGRAYYVGGFVRDRLMGSQGKDVDIEIHGITPDVLASILDSLGERTVMGASFGIFGLKHYDLDIAMPRQEKAVGKGHRDFQVFVDPFIGTEKAAMRRDFTVNALMEDVLTGEVIDHFGGREDLKNKLLRHINSSTFAEDPLRVLRGAQFAARFNFAIHPDTVKLCSCMDLTALPRERIMGELEKALVKAEKPSVFFECLREMHQNDFWFPELSNADLSALDEAAKLRSSSEKPLYFMFSALCAKLSLEKVTSLLGRLTDEKELRDYALSMSERHKCLYGLCLEDAAQYSWNLLFDSAVCPRELPVLCRAIYGDSFPGEKCLQKLSSYCELMAKPHVMGRDLIAVGMKPGENFSKLLAAAHDLHLQGIEKDEALGIILNNGTA